MSQKVALDFVGGAYTQRSAQLNAQTCKNFYLIIDPTGAKKPKALYGTPGLTSFCDLETSAVGCRGLHKRGNFIYGIYGATVWKINENGEKWVLGNTMLSSTGHCWMADNATEVMITDGVDGYYITAGDVLTRITDADFPANPISVTFQDGYFIVVNGGTGNFYTSPSFDASGDWDSTAFSTTWRNPDNLMGGIAHQGQLWLIGKRSVERYYNSGATFPYERVNDSYIPRGCVATDSIAAGGTAVFWLSDNGEVLMSQGYEAVPVSTEHIAYIIDTYSVVSDAVGFTYIQDGHEFYFLTFPTADATWVLDITTTALQGGIPAWHQRLTGTSQHQANAYVSFPTLVNTGSAVVDDDCADDDTGDWTQDGDSLAFDTDHYEFASSGANKICYVGSLAFTVGKSYKISIDLKDGTATPSDLQMYFYDGAAQYGDDINTTGTSTTYSFTFLCATTVTTTGRIGFRAQTSLGAANMEFKNVAAYEVVTGKNQPIVGDRADSQLYRLDLTKYTDNGTTITSERTSRSIHSDGKMLFFHSLQIDFEAGVGNADDTDPTASLDWSDDGAANFSTAVTAKMGQATETTKRAVWRRLGKSRDRIFRVKITAPVKRVIKGAFVEVEAGMY